MIDENGDIQAPPEGGTVLPGDITDMSLEEALAGMGTESPISAPAVGFDGAQAAGGVPARSAGAAADVPTEAGQPETPKKGKKKKKKSLIPPILMCLLGLLILFRPVAMDWYATWQATQKISEMSGAYEPEDDPELIAVKDNAKAYNNRIAGIPTQGVEIKPYEEQMRFRGIEQMAWIDIPKIEVALPIYHGTGQDALAAGVGHLSDSSLPVGGTSSHCVLTGHSGMQGERMFDEIRYLQIGDTFIIHSLGEPYAYRIYAIETVWPHETESLGLQAGRDLCTLITCTPYGINDHRLLIHAERCEYLPEMEPSLPPRISYWNTRSVIFFSAAMLVLVVMLSLVVRNRMNKKEARKAAGEQGASAEHKGKRRKKAGNLVLPAAMIMTGLLILFSSVIIDWFETWQAQQSIQRVSSEIASIDPARKQELLEQAEIYNELLTGDTVRYSKLEKEGRELLPYEEQLLYAPGMPMAWVDIPKISTKIPIYHGTDDNVLMMGAGHIEQSSLPVPGESVHSVVSAHSGMVLTRMFDEIRVLEPGDVFIYWVLGEPYAYEVTDTEVILPDDTAGLGIERGKDKTSLVTCTPYGINDHRLLVHAERVEYKPEMDTVPMDAYVNYRTVPFLIGILIGVPSLILIFRAWGKRRSRIDDVKDSLV